MAGAIAGTAILNCGLTNELDTVTLTINNSCNLTCPHCYLQYDDHGSIIDGEVLRAVCVANFRHLAIVGKEPLLDSASIELCDRIAERCVSLSRSVSLVTNGLGLLSVPPTLLKSLAYIDISLDGGPNTYHVYRRGSLAKIVAGLAHLAQNRFNQINALHVLNDSSIEFLADMVKVSEMAEFQKIMFSPYIRTMNHGTNEVKVVPLERILETLSRSSPFMEQANAFLLVDVNHLAQAGWTETEFTQLAARLGLVAKIRLISDDPLLYGIIRVTYDGFVLTPLQSIHTRYYRSVGLNLRTSNGMSLQDIYWRMRLNHGRGAYEN